MMEPRVAAGYLPLVHAIGTGNANFKMFDDEEDSSSKEVEDEHTIKYAIVGSSGVGMFSAARLEAEGIGQSTPLVAIIPYKEPVQKYGDWCSYGTEWLASVITEAANNPQVSAIVLDIDSGGGAADAVNAPSGAILEARKKKPVIGYAGNGMVASAAYWIMSHTQEIFATYASDEIGSIGTYVTMINYEKFLQEWYKSDVHTVYASRSSEKNKGYRDVTAQESSSEWLLTKELDPFNDVFITTVKKNRPNINNDVFKGRLYMAEEAVELGLIDGMKSLEETIDYAYALSQEYESKETTTMFGNKFKNVAKLIETAAADRTPEMLSAAEAEISASGLRLISAEEVDQLQVANTDLNSRVETLNGQIEQLNNANAEIAASLGLGVSEQGLTNAAGEETTLLAEINALVGEVKTLRAKSSGLDISDSGSSQEGPGNEENEAVAAMNRQIDEKLNQIM